MKLNITASDDVILRERTDDQTSDEFRSHKHVGRQSQNKNIELLMAGLLGFIKLIFKSYQIQQFDGDVERLNKMYLTTYLDIELDKDANKDSVEILWQLCLYFFIRVAEIVPRQLNIDSSGEAFVEYNHDNMDFESKVNTLLSEEQLVKADSYINQFISKISSASIKRVIEFRMDFDRMFRVGVGGAWKKNNETGLRQMQDHEPIVGHITSIDYKNSIIKVCCRLSSKCILIKYKVGEAELFPHSSSLSAYEDQYVITVTDNYLNDGKDEYDIKNSEFHFVDIAVYKSDVFNDSNLSLFDETYLNEINKTSDSISGNG